MTRRPPNSASTSPGFTIIELVVLLVIVVLLVAVVIPGLYRAKEKSRRIYCNNNLKQIGLSFILWSGDSSDRYPMAASTNDHGSLEVANAVWQTFLVMSNELFTPIILACPADTRPPAPSWRTLANSNISYFIGLDAADEWPDMPLSGDSHLTTDRSASNRVLTVQSNDVVRWGSARHGELGNLGLSDGSAQQVNSVLLNSNFNASLTTYQKVRTNAPLRLALPEF
jgi:type II secretory pathway pseudopilin PulG